MGSSAIERTDTGYRLGDDLNVDIDVVESIVAEGRQAVADGRQDAAAELFQQAGEMFRGDACANSRTTPPLLVCADSSANSR